MYAFNRWTLASLLLVGSLATGCGYTVAQQDKPSPQPPATTRGGSGAQVSTPPSSVQASGSQSLPRTEPAATAPIPGGLTAGQGGVLSGTPPSGSSFGDELKAAQKQVNNLSNGWTQSIKDWNISTAKKSRQR